jgi:hypothetical protein
MLYPYGREINFEGLRILQQPKVLKFFLGGGAFRQLKADLSSLLEPKPLGPYQMMRLANTTITELSSSSVLANSTHVLKMTLKTLLSELLQAEHGTIRIATRGIDDCRPWWNITLDQLKWYVGNLTGTPWDWWPFTPPFVPKYPKNAAVMWKCVSS